MNYLEKIGFPIVQDFSEVQMKSFDSPYGKIPKVKISVSWRFL
jgi:hypothetical protein